MATAEEITNPIASGVIVPSNCRSISPPISEPTTPGTGFLTGLLAVHIDDGAPWLVAGSTNVIDSVVVRGLTAAWVGGGTLGKVEIRAR